MGNKYLEKVAELEKVSGNRLVRYISENRGDFPLSRLKSLSSQGMIKSPEQLLPGRNLGAVNQFNATAKRHGMVPREGVVSDSEALGVAKVQRQSNLHSDYFSRSMRSGNSNVQQTKVPALHSPVAGNDVENIRRLHDTHVSNHETFEMDEAFRMMDRGRSRNVSGLTLPSLDYHTVSHHNPAVLLRESRDMSSNPYSHISPPAIRVSKPLSVARSAAKEGEKDAANIISSQRAIPYDTSLPVTRGVSGQASLVSSLQRGRPYQSNPTSAEISRARNVSPEDSQRILDSHTGGALSKIKSQFTATRDIMLGNKAYRT